MEFNEFLMNNAWWLATACAGVVLLSIILILVFAKRKKAVPVSKKTPISASAYLEALGGSDNVISHERKGSRIVLELKDYDIVDREKLKEAGVDGFIMMSSKLTLVIKGDAEKVERVLFPNV